MQLVTFDSAHGPALGALAAGGRIVDLNHAAALAGIPSGCFLSMQALIEAGPEGLATARTLMADSAVAQRASLPASAVRLLAPLPRPEQIRDCLSFEAHLRNSMNSTLNFLARQSDDEVAARERLKASGRFEIPRVWYDIPLYYKANRFAVSGPGEEIRWPSYCERLDYELELAAVIGAGGRDISRDDALAHIFGFTIFNDFSARDAQLRETAGGLGPAKGKDFDTANAFGPCIVTMDEIGDPHNLQMEARVNGERRCLGNSRDMHHRFDAIIAHISQSETLHPGEIICSGTVGGGSGLEIDRYLEPGDVVELEIEKIGVLRNTIGRRA